MINFKRKVKPIRIGIPKWWLPYTITWLVLIVADAAQTYYALSQLYMEEASPGSAWVLAETDSLETMLVVGVLSSLVLASLVVFQYRWVQALALSFLGGKLFAVVSNATILYMVSQNK